jgi:hypothetical protein
MAYQRKDETQKDDQQPIGGKTPGMLSGYLSTSTVPLAQPNLYGTGGSAPTATGHVNFDRIYAANEGTAQRDARAMGNNATRAAGQAHNALGDFQSRFNSQSAAAAGHGPSSQEQQWAASGATGVTPGKQVKAAYFDAPSVTQSESPQQRGPPPRTVSDRELVAMGKPDSTGKQWNSLAEYDAANPDSGGTPTDTSHQSYVTESQEGLDSGGAGVTRDAQGNVIGTTDARDSSGDATNEAAVRAGAAAQYGGPGSLADMGDYQNLLDQYGKAEQGLKGLQDNNHIQGALEQDAQGPHIEGGSKLDAALIGQAGRPEFARIGEMYKGFGDEVGAANAASIATADANKATAAQNASQYQGLLDQYTGRQSADQAAEDASQARSNQKVTDAQQHAENQRNYVSTIQRSNHGLAGARNWFHDAAVALNPVDLAARAGGVTAPTDAGSNYFGKQYAGDKDTQFNEGNRSPAWGPDDADVFASMGPDDWAQFNGMSVNDQKNWIKERRRKLQGGKS